MNRARRRFSLVLFAVAATAAGLAVDGCSAGSASSDVTDGPSADGGSPSGSSSGGPSSGSSSGSPGGSSSGSPSASSSGSGSSSSGGTTAGSSSGGSSSGASSSSGGPASNPDAGASDDGGSADDGGTFTPPMACSCGSSAPAGCTVWTHVFMTNYGFNDNSGSSEGDKNSADIAYPGYGPKKHTVATEGAGTYDDPITAASDTKSSFGAATLAPGTIIYNPMTQKYYILEDSCAECQADYACKYDDDEGDAAFPGDPPTAGGCKTNQFLHIDFWMGPTESQADPTDLYNCEDNSTIGDVYDFNSAITGPLNVATTDGTVIVNPPDNLPVRSGVLFAGDKAVPAGGGCWTQAQMLPYQEWCN
jgi:hypothetical protein